MHLIAALFVAGCSAPHANSGTDVSARLPAWVLNPSDKPGYMSIVGSAPKQSKGGAEAQHRVALLKARQELAESRHVQLKSVLIARTEGSAGQVSRSADIMTQLTSNEILNSDSIRVVEEWTDPLTGMLYVWYQIPVSSTF